MLKNLGDENGRETRRNQQGQAVTYARMCAELLQGEPRIGSRCRSIGRFACRGGSQQS